MSDTELPLPACDPDVLIERLDDGWYVECQEPFCGANEGGSWFGHRDAQKWRTAHRTRHQRGEAKVGHTFRTAWAIHNGCVCEWSGPECCPLHITAEDQRNWEALNV